MKSNKKNYLFNLVTNYGNTAITIILGFIVPPLSLSYWKVEKYGIWALVTSIVFYLGISGLGIETSASILMAKNKGYNNKIKILQKAFRLMTITIITGLTIFTIINLFYKDWIFILGKIPKYLIEETYISIIIYCIFYFLNLPFSLVSSAFNGFQKLYIDNFFKIAGSAISFISLIIVINIKGTLVTFALVLGLITLTVNLIKFLYFYFFIYKKGKPEIPEQEPETISSDIGFKMILSTGVRLSIFGIASLVINSADNFVISNFIDVAHVTPYSITYKLFYIMINVVTMFYGSISPILGKEFSENNWDWINKTYRNFIIFTSIIGGGMWIGGIFFIKDFIIMLWVGKDGFAGIMAVFFLGAFCYLQSLINLNNIMIIAFNFTKGFAIIGWIEAILHISFAIIFSKIFGLGGIALGAFLSSLLGQTILSPWLLLRRSDKKLKINILIPLKHLLIAILPFLIIGEISQKFISNVFINLISGVFCFIIYLCISYLIIPSSTKLYIIENINMIFNKIHYFNLKLRGPNE